MNSTVLTILTVANLIMMLAIVGRGQWLRLIVDGRGFLGTFGQAILSNAVIQKIASQIKVGVNPLVGANPEIAGTVIAGNVETVQCAIGWQQGGTVAAPADFIQWKIALRDAATKAPFQSLISGATFNATFDATWAQGYNPDLAVVTEPAIYWRLEQNYEVTPGTHWFEYYVEYFGINRAHAFRPIYLNVNRATDTGQLLFHLPGATVGGSIQILSGDETQNYLQINNAGWFWRNNFPLYIFDADGVTQRVLATLTSGGYLVIGDQTLTNSTILRGGAGAGGLAGLIAEVGPTNRFDIYDSVNAPQFSFKTNIQPGGEVSFHINGPSPTAPAAPAAGWTIYEDAATGNLNAINAAGHVRTLALA